MTRSRRIDSPQTDLYPRLADRVRRHMAEGYQRPLAAHNRQAFALAERWRRSVPDGPLILDAGCGTGDSSRRLAARFADHLVLGVDKSDHRLAKARSAPAPDNLLLLRADLVDLYRLMAAAGWRLTRHYLFYPNPWPKSGHFGRRWHGHPVFPALLSLGGRLELRSNWQIYVEEFAAALSLAKISGSLSAVHDRGDPVSPFEAKYAASDHTLWRLVAHVPPHCAQAQSGKTVEQTG